MLIDHFYSRLKPLRALIEITDPQSFVSVPNSWYIVITDVVGSTQAIAEGRYKDINMLGACSIVSMLNLNRDIELPFVFGGDGASILIPPSLFEAAQETLLANQHMAWSRFKLQLRIGTIPVSTIVEKGYSLKIAKLKVSDHYYQAMFRGGGLTYATEIVKEHGISGGFRLQHPHHPHRADFSGLECRWQDIQAAHDEVVSLHVMAIAHSRWADQTYRDVLSTIQRIYGTSENFHPLASQHLHLTFNPHQLSTEVNIRTGSQGALKRFTYLCQIWLENLLGAIFMRFKLALGDTDWGAYPTCVAAATDYQKFDDTLRMIISGNSSQSQQLSHYLDERYRSGELVYGLHVSDRVLMTCLVFERNGRQVHFIDGADGGLTTAATDLKQRMQQKALNWRTFLRLLKIKESRDRLSDII
ncbi:MAG TPA: DUF3095 domain-containing protein [Elainellaceae cyanobacterium]